MQPATQVHSELPKTTFDTGKPIEPSPTQWHGHAITVVADPKAMRNTIIAAAIIATIGLVLLVVFSSPIAGGIILGMAALSIPYNRVRMNQKISLGEIETINHLKKPKQLNSTEDDFSDLYTADWKRLDSSNCELKMPSERRFRAGENGKLLFVGFVNPNKKEIFVFIFDNELKKARWTVDLEKEKIALKPGTIECSDLFDPNGKLMINV